MQTTAQLAVWLFTTAKKRSQLYSISQFTVFLLIFSIIAAFFSIIAAFFSIIAAFFSIIAAASKHCKTVQRSARTRAARPSKLNIKQHEKDTRGS